MSIGRRRSGFVLAILLASGCMGPVMIREHKFVVSDLRETAAEQIESELKRDGINVRRVVGQSKGSILGDNIADDTFVIADPNYTDRDLTRVTNRLTNPKRNDPIVVQYTIVQQRYASASGEGVARVELRVDLTENAKAFYKKTGARVALRRTVGEQTSTFDYQRRSGEEYVDIYVVPDYADASFKPGSFIRISLSYPYAAKRLPWEPGVLVRLWRSLFGKKAHGS